MNPRLHYIRQCRTPHALSGKALLFGWMRGPKKSEKRFKHLGYDVVGHNDCVDTSQQPPGDHGCSVSIDLGAERSIRPSPGAVAEYRARGPIGKVYTASGVLHHGQESRRFCKKPIRATRRLNVEILGSTCRKGHLSRGRALDDLCDSN
jgi:hypothetical protein